MFIEESMKGGKVLKTITKVNIPMLFDHFHSVSLCNSIYKIIFGIIVAHLKHSLSKNISREKMGFLYGHDIQDGIDTTHEILHTKKTLQKQSFIAKIDLSKFVFCSTWLYLQIILIQL
jgi:hypothetical protein